MRGIVKGDLIVGRDGHYGGIVNGDVVVRPGCQARIGGIVNGDVIVEAGAEADITGVVNGEVVERGGVARITGLVSD